MVVVGVRGVVVGVSGVVGVVMRGVGVVGVVAVGVVWVSVRAVFHGSRLENTDVAGLMGLEFSPIVFTSPVTASLD